MEYQDKSIVELQKLKQKQVYSTLETGMYINNQIVEFERRTYFDEALSVLLPVSFVPMPEEQAKIKYPVEQRPQVIESNLDGSVNFTMSYFPMKVQPDELARTKDTFRTAVTVMNPAVLFFDDKVQPLGKTNLAWFDYRGYALDDQIYNLMFATTIEGKLLFGTFNCRFADFGEWKPAVIQMIESMEDITGGRIR